MALPFKKKILITGSTGFIGKYIVKRALAEEYEIFLAIRETSDTSAFDHLNVTKIVMDFSSETSIAESFPADLSFDTVIHNAGVKTSSSKIGYYRNNVNLTRKICSALRRERVLKGNFIYISSLAASGPGNDQTMEGITETKVERPISNYGKSKLLAEKEVVKSGLDYIIIRPTAVFGKGGDDYKKLVSLAQNNIAIYLADPGQALSFIHADDLSRLIFIANASFHKNQVFNASDTHNYTLESFYEIIFSTLKQKIRHKVHVPFYIVKSIAWINHYMQRVIKIKNPLDGVEKAREITALNWKCSSEKIKRELNFTANHSLNEIID